MAFKNGLFAGVMVVAFLLFIGAGYMYTTLGAGKLGVSQKIEVGASVSAATADTLTSWITDISLTSDNDSLIITISKDSTTYTGGVVIN